MPGYNPPHDILRYAKEEIKEAISSDGSLQELKDTIIHNQQGSANQVDSSLLGSIVAQVKADFSAGARPAGTEPPRQIYQEVQDLGLTKEVTYDRMGKDIAQTQIGAHRQLQTALTAIQGLDPSKIGFDRFGSVMNEITDRLMQQSRNLQLRGASTQTQGLAQIESHVTSVGGPTQAEYRGFLMQEKLRRSPPIYDYDTAAANANVDPRVQKAINRHEEEIRLAKTPGHADPKQNRTEAITGAGLADINKEWNNSAGDPARRMKIIKDYKREIFESLNANPQMVDHYTKSGTDYEKSLAREYSALDQDVADRARNSYPNIQEARGAAPQAFEAVNIGKGMIAQADTLSTHVSQLRSGSETVSGLSRADTDTVKNAFRELTEAANKTGSAFNATSDTVNNSFVKGWGGGGRGGGRGGRGGGGGGMDSGSFGDDPMTFSKLTFTSMDNIIGSLSYPLMDQALMKPMLAGMMSSEVMPGFVSSASGAEGIFDKVSGYLPRMGEDIKELELRQKSLKAVTGSYTASDQMIAHATEIAKAEPIQFGTAVQAFTSFSAFPGTREEVKGSQQFRESLTDVIQRLAVLVPEQGEQGASFALREIMSGQYKSLKQRFNMDLPQLTKAAGEPSMTQSKFEGLSGSQQIAILQKGLRVMTGETALAERSLTTSVQTEDLGDALMQSLSLKFVQPQGSTPLGMSKIEEERMRGIFYDQNRRTMGSRLTDQQLYDRTNIQLETAQRSPIGAMAVGMQGMVDALQTTIEGKGIGSSIEKSITGNIFKPFMNATVGLKDDVGVESSGNRLTEAIDTLARGIKQTAKDLTGNDDIQQLMRSGIDAMVGTMTSTLAPGLGYGMAAGAAGSWSALMNPATVKTIIGGAANTVTSSNTPWGDSLSLLAPMAMMGVTGIGEFGKKIGFRDDDELSAFREKRNSLNELRDKNLPIDRSQRIGVGDYIKNAGSMMGQMSPDASIRAVMSAAVLAGGVQGLISPEADMMTKLTSVGMTGFGMMGLASSFGDNLKLTDMFGRNQTAGSRWWQPHKGMVGPGILAMTAGAGVLAQSFDESARIKQMMKEQDMFDSQYSELSQTNPDLYRRLMVSRSNVSSKSMMGEWGSVGGAILGGAIGSFVGGQTIAGAMIGSTVLGGAGASWDAYSAGTRKEDYDKIKSEADASITYTGRIRKLEEAVRLTSLAQTGDTSRFARDLKTSYDINSSSFSDSPFETMLQQESKRRGLETGLEVDGVYGGWRKGFGINDETPTALVNLYKDKDGKETLSYGQATEKIEKYETGFTGFTADKANQDILTSLDKADIEALQDASINKKTGRQDFANNEEWKGQSESALELMKSKGINSTSDQLERFIKLITSLGDELGKIKDGKEGKNKSEDVIDEGLKFSNAIQQIKKQEDDAASEILASKSANFFLKGEDAVPNYFDRSREGLGGQTIYDQKLKNDWTQKEYNSKDGAAARLNYLMKVGQEMQAASDQYDGMMDYAQKERSSGGGFFNGYTPDIIKDVNSGLQGTLIDMYAESGDVGAQELKLIREEREERLRSMLDDTKKHGKAFDREGAMKELGALRGLGGDYKLRQEVMQQLNQGLGHGITDNKEHLDWIKNTPGNTGPGKIIGGVARGKNEEKGPLMFMPDGTSVPISGMTEDELAWRRAQGGTDLASSRNWEPKTPQDAMSLYAMREADKGNRLLGRDNNRVDRSPAGLYASSMDRFSANWSKNSKPLTVPEIERLTDIANSGTVVDVVDGDTVKVAGERGVATVRLADHKPQYVTDKFGKKREVQTSYLNSPEIGVKYRGREGILNSYRESDEILKYLGVDTDKQYNTRSLVEGGLEDSRQIMAGLIQEAGDDKIKRAAVSRVMGHVDRGRMFNQVADGGAHVLADKSELSKNRVRGYLLDSQNRDLTDNLLGSYDGSELSKEIYAFQKQGVKREDSLSMARRLGILESNKFFPDDGVNATLDEKKRAVEENEPLMSLEESAFEAKRSNAESKRIQDVRSRITRDPKLRPMFQKEHSKELDQTKLDTFIEEFQKTREDINYREIPGLEDDFGPRPDRTVAVANERNQLVQKAMLEATGTEKYKNMFGFTNKDKMLEDAISLTESIQGHIQGAFEDNPIPARPDGFQNWRKEAGSGFRLSDSFISNNLPAFTDKKPSAFGFPDWASPQRLLGDDWKPLGESDVKSWWDSKGQARLSDERAESLMSHEKIGVRELNPDGTYKDDVKWYHSDGQGILTDDSKATTGTSLRGLPGLRGDDTVSMIRKKLDAEDPNSISKQFERLDSGGKSDDTEGVEKLGDKASKVADNLETLNRNLIKMSSAVAGISGALKNSRYTV